MVSRALNLATLTSRIPNATPDKELNFDGHHLTTVYGPRWRLLIIGAGQTSQYLAQMAQALNYEVIICEPRVEFREVWMCKIPLLFVKCRMMQFYHTKWMLVLQ